MLYETLAQPIILLWLFVCGFCCGFLFDGKNAVWRAFGKNKILGHILDFAVTAVIGLIFFVLILKINYGEIRAYEILCFALSVVCQRASARYLLAFLRRVWYNFQTKK